MSSVDKAIETQKQNIQAKTGKSLAELESWIRDCDKTKHGEIREALMKEFSLGYGDASMAVHFALKTDAHSMANESGASIKEITDGYYEKKTAVQREVHDLVMEKIEKFGDFEIAPKKTYLSLRRKRQFAMLGPASKGRVEVGLNMKDVPGTGRLMEQKPGGMCQYKVYLSEPSEVDEQLLDWIRTAYDASA